MIIHGIDLTITSLVFHDCRKVIVSSRDIPIYELRAFVNSIVFDYRLVAIIFKEISVLLVSENSNLADE